MDNIRRLYQICALKLPQDSPTPAFNFYGVRTVVMNPKKYNIARYDNARMLVDKVAKGGSHEVDVGVIVI